MPSFVTDSSQSFFQMSIELITYGFVSVPAPPANFVVPTLRSSAVALLSPTTLAISSPALEITELLAEIDCSLLPSLSVVTSSDFVPVPFK